MPAKIKLPSIVSSQLYLLVLAAWFITLSFIIDNYWSANSNQRNVERKLTDYVHNHEKDFARLSNDSVLITNLVKGNVTEQEAATLLDKPYSFFIYQEAANDTLQLRFWSSQKILPDPQMVAVAGKAGFAELANGYYVWNKTEKFGTIMMALIPIKWNYYIPTSYLQNVFVADKRIGNYYDLFPGKAKQGSVTSVDGSPLFYIKSKDGSSPVTGNNFSLFLKIVSSILILLFLHFCAVYLSIKRRFIYGFLFLAGSVIILRTISYFIPIPFNLRQLELFDPTIYGSSNVLRSLGDLLINAGLFVWIVLFTRSQVQEKDLKIHLNEPNQKWWLLGMGALVMVLATFTCSSILASLVADSQISFDVINFFSLSFYSVVGFAIICCIAIGYYFLCQTILVFFKPFFKPAFVELYIAVSIAGLIVLTFGSSQFSAAGGILVLLWLLVFLLLLNSSFFSLYASLFISSRLVFWIFFFSVSIAIVILSENRKKELDQRYHHAATLAKKTDAVSGSFLSSMLSDFRSDFLYYNFDRLKDPESNRFLKDSLIANNTKGYNTRYRTEIYSFDAAENPLFNSGRFDYKQLNSILNSQAKPTTIAGLYYIDVSFDKFSYITKRSITDTAQNLMGTVFIVVTPTNVKEETIEPEIFGRIEENSIENSTLYSFAIYEQGKLVTSYNDYAFSTTLPDIKMQGKDFVRRPGYDHDELWYNAGGGKLIVIVKENRFFIEAITLFSYIFCSFLLLAALFWLLTVFISSRFNPQKLRTYWQLTIRNQIHGVIIFISAASFLVIGTATILFFINRYENNNREKLSRSSQIMKAQVGKLLQGGWKLMDSLKIHDENQLQELDQSLIDISDIHGIELNIYNLQGDLKLSSRPYPYMRGVLSSKMDPMAYQHVARQKEVQYFQKEQVGEWKYLSSYVPVNDENGNTYAYLNSPYFTSQSNLQQEIANFLVTIINLNAFIFLIAGIVALFIATRITHSFAVIGEKMKKVNLGTHNEAIEWNRNDELGSLVDEYNKMVSKLDESAAALAKTERESAWREMAKQVAHEIKNPLTPMKLSMQFLQRSIENNAPDVKELTDKVANTLVEQIDHLSKIASDFSQFANIEKADKTYFDLNDTLASVQQLHQTNDKVNLHWELMETPAIIFADKTHINRLFTNLLLNAIQAVPADRKPEIFIRQSTRHDRVLVEVQDNGDGIPEPVQSKIFTPNFTTKSSGTGLGLAMCKRIVEQANGSIWFETLDGKGTSFFVSLPLASEPV